MSPFCVPGYSLHSTYNHFEVLFWLKLTLSIVSGPPPLSRLVPHACCGTEVPRIQWASPLSRVGGQIRP